MDLFPDIFAAKRMVSTGVVTTSNVITGAQYQYGAVGTYVIAFFPMSQITYAGATVAGSSLLYMATPATANTYSALNILYTSLGSTLIGTNGATNLISLNLSGTWRLMTNAVPGSNLLGTSLWFSGLFVRIV